MYKIGYIGNFKTVPQVVEHIINNDIDNLEKEYNNGWDINQKIVLSEYTDITPIEIAIQCNSEQAIRWLLEKGVNVRAKEGDWATPISDAARFCTTEICELFIQHGALENLTKRQCKRKIINKSITAPQNRDRFRCGGDKREKKRKSREGTLCLSEGDNMYRPPRMWTVIPCEKFREPWR